MFSKHVATHALVILVAVPAAALAQSDPCGRPTSLHVSIGLGQSDRADAAINSSQYQGRGPRISLGAAANTRGICVEAFAAGGAHYLRPVAGAFGSERTLDGQADLRVLEPVIATASRATLAIGLAAQVSVTGTEHSYADASAPSHYRLRIGSLGVAVGAARPIAGGHARFDATLPLVSVVDHPYVATSALDPVPGLRVATWSSLRGGTGELGYERSLSRAVTAGVAYRVSGLRYDDARPVRTLSQTLALELRFARPAKHT
jgi:hypothetical protein